MSLPTTVDTRRVYRGDPYALQITFLDDDSDPIDLSASTFTAGLADTTENWTVDTTNAAAGVITLELSAAATALIISGTPAWDLAESPRWTQTLLRGQLAMSQRVKPGTEI